MDTANALVLVDDDPFGTERPVAVLRGTARGLEIVVLGTATVEAITSEVMERLDEAPAFFRGSDCRIRVDDGPLPAGCLARLDEIAQMYELRIIEVTAKPEAVPLPNIAEGSAPVEEDVAEPPVTLPPEDAIVELAPEEPMSFEEPTQTAVAIPVPSTEIDSISPGTRIVIGPVRSGVILDHTGHLIVFGDVNPGAEVRATGNIVVLGRLRGTAHAGIGQDVGFILSLRLEPQQLRIGRQVARAGDSDQPTLEPEIAYGTGGGIIVERYLGKLPHNLASSI